MNKDYLFFLHGDAWFRQAVHPVCCAQRLSESLKSTDTFVVSMETVKMERNEVSINEQQADSIIEQLSHAMSILMQGRGYGIRVVATQEAIDNLSKSKHPDTKMVVSNLLVLDREIVTRCIT